MPNSTSLRLPVNKETTFISGTNIRSVQDYNNSRNVSLKQQGVMDKPEEYFSTGIENNRGNLHYYAKSSFINMKGHWLISNMIKSKNVAIWYRFKYLQPRTPLFWLILVAISPGWSEFAVTFAPSSWWISKQLLFRLHSVFQQMMIKDNIYIWVCQISWKIYLIKIVDIVLLVWFQPFCYLYLKRFGNNWLIYLQTSCKLDTVQYVTELWLAIGTIGIITVILSKKPRERDQVMCCLDCFIGVIVMFKASDDICN